MLHLKGCYGSRCRVFENSKYVIDPHGAVGYLGAKDFLKENDDYQVIVLETAHPAKFIDVVEEEIPEKVEIPPRLAEVLDKEKKSIPLDAKLSELKDFLNS